MADHRGVPDAKNLQAYNRYTYVNNNPLKYVDPTGHFFFAFLAAVFIGALVGGATAATFGGNIWVGMLTGAVTGAVFFGAGQAIQAINVARMAGGQAALSLAGQVSIHAAAGAVAGVINNTIAGGGVDRLGKAALVGGISGGMGKLVGGFLSDERFFVQLFARSGTGAASGAFAASIMGGDPLTGAWQGAAIAGAGSVFNDLWHDKVMPYLRRVFHGSRIGFGVGLPGGKLKLGPWLKVEGQIHAIAGYRVGSEGIENFFEAKIGGSVQLGKYEFSLGSINGNPISSHSVYSISNDLTAEFGGNIPLPDPPLIINTELHLNLRQALGR